MGIAIHDLAVENKEVKHDAVLIYFHYYSPFSRRAAWFIQTIGGCRIINKQVGRIENKEKNINNLSVDA